MIILQNWQEAQPNATWHWRRQILRRWGREPVSEELLGVEYAVFDKTCCKLNQLQICYSLLQWEKASDVMSCYVIFEERRERQSRWMMDHVRFDSNTNSWRVFGYNQIQFGILMSDFKAGRQALPICPGCDFDWPPNSGQSWFVRSTSKSWHGEISRHSGYISDIFVRALIQVIQDDSGATCGICSVHYTCVLVRFHCNWPCHFMVHGVHDMFQIYSQFPFGCWWTSLEGVVPRPEVDSIFDLAPSTA